MKIQTFVSLADAKERFGACNCADNTEEYDLYLRDEVIKEHIKRGGDKNPWSWVDQDGIGCADEGTNGWGEESSRKVGGEE